MKRNRSIYFMLVITILVISVVTPLIQPVSGYITRAKGYVKDDVTGNGISSAYVTVYGRYEDSRGFLRSFSRSGYTSSSGYYNIVLPSNTLYLNRLRATKSGYVAYDGSVKYTVYLVPLSCTLSFSGQVLENQIIENINRPNAEDLSLDIAPPGVVGYSPIISDEPIYVKFYDRYDRLFKTISCSQTDGTYSTGVFSAPVGTVTIKVEDYVTGGSYKTATRTEVITTSTTFTDYDFLLNRDLGQVWVYGDASSTDVFSNFQITMNNWGAGSNYLMTDLTSWCPPSLVYNPFNTQYTEFFISSNMLVQGFQKDLWKYKAKNAEISLYVLNHYTGDEDFIELEDIGYRDDSYGNGRNIQWTFTSQLGWAPTDTDFSGQLQLSATLTPADTISFEKNLVRDDDTDYGTKLGSIFVDYSDNPDLSKDFATNWHIKLDNGISPDELFTLKQCGAHVTFKLVYKILIGPFAPIGGWQDWLDSDKCYLNFEQILGDDVDSLPLTYITDLYGNPIYDFYHISYGAYSGHDYWMNLLAGDAGLLPI